MAYVVVVFAIINTAAIGAMAWWLMHLYKDFPTMVEAVIQDEVRRQDDRIEKRAQRASGPAEDAVPTAVDGQRPSRVEAGRPTRR